MIASRLTLRQRLSERFREGRRWVKGQLLALVRLPIPARGIRGVRKRLIWVCIAFGLGGSLSWYFQKAVIGWLLAPAHGALSATGQPIFTSPTDMFNLSIRLTMIGGVVVAVPMLALQTTGLLGPYISARQRRFITLFLLALLACFLCGVSFAYWVLLPAGLDFLLQFGTDIAQPMIQITEYMDLALAMLFWLGAVFELPLAMFLLAKLKIVSHQRLSRLRRYAQSAAIIFSMIITPTGDPVNMVFLAVPIIVLYEVGLGLAWAASRSQRA